VFVENISAQLPLTGQWGTLVRTPVQWEPDGMASFTHAGEIHVFMVRADVCAETLDRYASLLGPVERTRECRFRFDRDRSRFIAAHGALRTIVGAYAAIPPAELDICYSTFGKPLLGGKGAHSRIEFNLSHAGDIALIALSKGLAVGVDVERVPAGAEWAGLADVCLSVQEKKSLESIPADRMGETVYRWWTRKEALAKAGGTGLSQPLPHYQVVPPFLANAGKSSGRSVWDITPCPGYVASLVVEAPPDAVSLRMFKYQADPASVRNRPVPTW